MLNANTFHLVKSYSSDKQPLTLHICRLDNAPNRCFPYTHCILILVGPNRHYTFYDFSSFGESTRGLCSLVAFEEMVRNYVAALVKVLLAEGNE